MNEYRASIGLERLTVSPSLTRGAAWKALHMAWLGYMQHDDPGPVPRGWSERLEACGYPVWTAGAGENVAYGYRTPAEVMAGWLGSPEHRANIESLRWRAIGVAAAVGADGVVRWAQEFGGYDDSGAAAAASPLPSPPVIELTSTPDAATSSNVATFAWGVSGTVASTTCVLDGGAPVACASPTRYGDLTHGRHTFVVTVEGPSGSASAEHAWTIEPPADTPPDPGSRPPAPSPPPAATGDAVSTPNTRDERGRPAVSFSATSRAPTAGHLFSVRLAFAAHADRDGLVIPRVSCSASVSGRPLPTVARAAGVRTARCSWRLPAGASGRWLKATLAVRAGGFAIERSLARRIR